jgi:transcriptional regulator
MSKNFNNLRKKMRPTAQKAATKKTQLLLKEMALHELRRTQHVSQEKLATALNTKQANISRIERRSDMYISTLRNYIEALGGQLDIIARFSDEEIHINQF